MNFYWLFLATLFCAFVGYRLAVHYRMSGITGVTISLTLCVTFGTNLWRSLLIWAMMGDHLVTASATLITAATLFAFVEKYKFLALVKLVTMLFPVSLASVSLPQFAASWTGTEYSGPQMRWIQTLSGRDTTRFHTIDFIRDGAGRANSANGYFAKVSTKSSLYKSTDRKLVRSATVVNRGTWVLASSKIVDAAGKHWIKVMLPTENGEYQVRRSQTGFIPMSHISSQIPLLARIKP